MYTPSIDIVSECHVEWGLHQRRWKRFAGFLVTLYALCLPVAMVVAPIGLVVVFEYPVVTALKLTLFSMVPGYVLLVLLAIGESHLLASDSRN